MQTLKCYLIVATTASWRALLEDTSGLTCSCHSIGNKHKLKNIYVFNDHSNLQPCSPSHHENRYFGRVHYYDVNSLCGCRAVAMAFLNNDPSTWKASMRHCVPEDGRENYVTQDFDRNSGSNEDGRKLITPMRMLIQLMPG